jgi:hypothetical protein
VKRKSLGGSDETAGYDGVRQGYSDGAKINDCEFVDNPPIAILGQNADPHSGLDADGAKALRQSVNIAFEFGESPGAAVSAEILHQRAVWVSIEPF